MAARDNAALDHRRCGSDQRPEHPGQETIEGRYLGMLRDLLSLSAGLPLRVRVVLQDARPTSK